MKKQSYELINVRCNHYHFYVLSVYLCVNRIKGPDCKKVPYMPRITLVISNKASLTVTSKIWCWTETFSVSCCCCYQFVNLNTKSESLAKIPLSERSRRRLQHQLDQVACYRMYLRTHLRTVRTCVRAHTNSAKFTLLSSR